jgi:hypothetical protein
MPTKVDLTGAWRTFCGTGRTVVLDGTFLPIEPDFLVGLSPRDLLLPFLRARQRCS